MSDYIKEIKAREIISALGRPTVEVCVTTDGGINTVASVPSGTSKGTHEAFELHDGGSRYRGYGVRKAIQNVNSIIFPALRGLDIAKQKTIDEVMIDLDGTADKHRLGGNAIMPVSVACAKAGAASCGVPVYHYLAGNGKASLPVPMATVIAGGKFSSSSLDFEDFLYIYNGFETFAEAVEGMVESRLSLGSILQQRFGPLPEDGGALAPPLSDNREAFDIMLEAIDSAGLGGKVSLGIDVAANEFFFRQDGTYQICGRKMAAAELHDYYPQLVSEYGIIFIEDPFFEDDYSSFSKLTTRLPSVLVVGDDIYASNPGRIEKGGRDKATSGLLLKINQIGTVSEAERAAEMARRNKMSVIVSVRSRETNDDFTADFAVAVAADMMKIGAPIRGERLAKINRLLDIEASCR